MVGMRLIPGLLAALLSSQALAQNEHRSHAVTAAFQRLHPCPATGQPRGACPGYVKDHIVPLCAGGADSPDNMQWQTIAEGHAKDRLERRECAHRNG